MKRVREQAAPLAGVLLWPALLLFRCWRRRGRDRPARGHGHDQPGRRPDVFADAADPDPDDGADAAAGHPADDDGVHAHRDRAGHPAPGDRRRPDAAQPGADRPVAVPDAVRHGAGDRPRSTPRPRSPTWPAPSRPPMPLERARGAAQGLHARADARVGHRHLRAHLRRQGLRQARRTCR